MALQMYVPITHAKPESYIGGTMTIRPHPGSKIDLKIFTIRLVGISKTRIVSSHGSNEEVCESSTIFLDIEKEIHRGPMVLESDHVCQFSFLVPEDPASAQYDPFDAAVPWVREKPKPQKLPPSGQFGSGNHITYSLEASLIDESSRSEIKASTILKFSNTRAVETPDPRPVTTVQEKVLAGQGNINGLSSFELALDSPQVLIQEKVFPLILRPSEKRWRTMSFPLPEVQLKSCLVQLLVSTSIQGVNNTHDYWTEKHTIASFESRESNAEYLRITTQTLNLGMLLHNLSIPLHYPPTFKSTSIERTYGLEVLVTVDHGGDTSDLKFEVGPVTVLAAEYVGTERAREQARSDAAWSGRHPDIMLDDTLI